MIPNLSGIDHVHIYVADRSRAEDWYTDVMGLSRVEALMPWAPNGGPLTLEDAGGSIHLALFERAEPAVCTAIAFGTSGEDFLAWKDHLEEKGLKLRIADHKLSYSLYFHDPDRNMHEITTYDHDFVRGRLS